MTTPYYEDDLVTLYHGDLWDAPFAYPLSTGGTPGEPLELDAETRAEVQKKLDEIREAHAQAIASAQSYIVWR